MHAEWQHLASAQSIVAAIDLDGTLIPFAPTPQEAIPDGDTMALIEAFAAAPGVTLGIISGRPRPLIEDLVTRFPNVAFAAEHGVWRHATGSWESALDPVPQLDEIERALVGLAKRHTGALVERKTCSVCLHWRRVEEPWHARIAAAAEVIVDEWLETQPSIERLPGVEMLEVRHRAAHKGSALSWLRGHGPAGSPVLAIGDDITDEDMFVSLRENDIGIVPDPECVMEAGIAEVARPKPGPKPGTKPDASDKSFDERAAERREADRRRKRQQRERERAEKAAAGTQRSRGRPRKTANVEVRS